MPMLSREDISPRESLMHDWETEAAANARAHAIQIKELELAYIDKQQKLAIWFKIPILLILLPVKIVCAIALIVSYARKHEPSDNFWKALTW